MKPFPIDKVIAKLKGASKHWVMPSVSFIAVQTQDPFRILISTLLSLRTKDRTTIDASRRLFKLAPTSKKMVQLTSRQIEKAIFPVGFYRTKAKRILEISRTLIQKHKNKVPDTIETLLTLKGVGRKTANLVVILGYGKQGICVDTHVHRISNRWGYIKTKTPEQSEFALREILPKKHWTSYNDLLVSFGQNICLPVSPRCSQCTLEAHCPKMSVKHSR